MKTPKSEIEIGMEEIINEDEWDNHNLIHCELSGKEDYLLLKWGAIKEWNLHSKKGKQLLKKYFKTLKAGGLMLYDCTPENKKLICEIIDEANLDKIQLDWTGKWVSKEKAKKYVMEYKQ